MPTPTDDLRIRELRELSTPAQVISERPRTEAASAAVSRARTAVHRILRGEDDRLAVVIGPCSVHDVNAALDYARRLKAERDRLAGDLEIIMRVYFEKPRTTVGWKGLINDPHLDGSFAIDDGLRLARGLLADVNEMGLPAGCEFLDMITPQYIADLVGWGAIGARTTESQVHRELASGLSCPVGFKNGTDGNVAIAIDAIKAASQPHHFMAVTKDGRTAIAATTGNEDCHVVLRGGAAPNHDAQSVEAAATALARAGLPQRIMIDASHANSRKDPANQPAVVDEIAAQVARGDQRIFGVMIESHLVAGRQDLKPGRPLVYGQSITDGCIDWATSVEVLDRLAEAVRARRAGAEIRKEVAEALG
ncbi:MAG: 3-deoxy-7-phosphoheptulonate synthase [Phenylobacterium sp.]|uniref:3-deoxy-7-phosphoheptulonate synthase n=1 Tax=Phenylobacterium sp. TaxID=1871053 RepID=UPI0039192567